METTVRGMSWLGGWAVSWWAVPGAGHVGVTLLLVCWCLYLGGSSHILLNWSSGPHYDLLQVLVSQVLGYIGIHSKED